MNKPRLSFWQISNMSFGFLGIQFGWGLQLANMSAIYSYLGAKESDIPFLWLAGPVTGLIVQPIIGAMSDRTWNWAVPGRSVEGTKLPSTRIRQPSWRLPNCTPSSMTLPP